jgi:nitrous oxidase accessory protein NosD
MVALLAAFLAAYGQPPERAACTITLRPGEPLQAAIDRAPPGAVICLPAGTWTESIRVTKPLTLRGAGAERTTVRGAQLGHPVLWVGPLVETDATVVVSGITLTGARGSCPDPDGCAHGLLVERAQVEVVGCVFSENMTNGVHARDGAVVTITDSTLAGNVSHGLQVMGNAQVTLRTGTIRGNRRSGIVLSGTARVELDRSSVAASESHAVWLRDSSRLVATDSTFTESGGHGLYLTDRSSAELNGSAISSHPRAGIWIEHAAQATLTLCTITDTWDGVEVRDTARARIAACTITKSQWDGVKVHGTARAEILGSTISGGRGSGIRVAGSAQAQISHNRIDSWTAHGILSLSRVEPWGEGNRMWGNGVDLSGNLPGTLRTPLMPPTVEEVRFPNPAYTTVQEAVDALLPGGKLVLAEGIYTGGITIGKPLRIEADGVVLLTARSPGESAVLSLVGGADLVMTGIALGYGSDGLSLGADARAALTDCVISDNGRGVYAVDRARIALVRCRLSRNEQGGLWLWGAAHGELRECTFTANEVCGIGVGGTATATIVDCVITDSGWDGGIVIRDFAQAEIAGNSIVGNRGAGVALYHDRCMGRVHVFRGRISGGGNTFGDNDEGDVCPPELAFLAGEWGELDWRR